MSTWKLEQLFGKKADRITPGLERMERALAHLPPLRQTPAIVIAGTNGKGSTSAYLWRMLSSLGLRVGLYTSPHLVHFAERIFINQGLAPDDQFLLDELSLLESALPASIFAELSFFEVTTLLARWIFHKSQTDIDVLEVGLGGRWDATNAFSPMATAVTSIGLDHMQYLGDNLRSIAGEKLGIARPGVPMFWGTQAVDSDTEMTTQVAEERAASVGFPLFRAGIHFGYRQDSKQLEFRGPFFSSPNATEKCAVPTWLAQKPEFLSQNFATAAALLANVAPRLNAQFHFVKVQEAIGEFGDAESAPWPPSMRARFQELQVKVPGGKRSLLLDVCHNPHGARAFVRGLQETHPFVRQGGKLPAMISMLEDKDVVGTVSILREVLEPLVLYRVTSPRAWDPRQMELFRAESYPIFEEFGSAFRFASATFSQVEGPLVICGSVYGLGEALSYFETEGIS